MLQCHFEHVIGFIRRSTNDFLRNLRSHVVVGMFRSDVFDGAGAAIQLSGLYEPSSEKISRLLSALISNTRLASGKDAFNARNIRQSNQQQ